MDGDTMQKNLDEILKTGLGSSKDFEITQEEATKFQKAMKEPEFQSMLRDYMEEMQDPAQRAEQESYISELENQNRVPEGKELVRPMSGFVIKTKFTRDANEDDREKLFVNVVTSDKIPKPHSKPSRNRQGGESWSLPVAVGPLRMEKDKGGGNTTTFDVCYHPEALVRARRLDVFRDLVALSSLERVEDAFFRGTSQKMTADKSYRILKGVAYKSGPCAAMLIAKAAINCDDAAAAGTGGSKPITPLAEAKNPNGNQTRERKSKANKPFSVTSAIDESPAARVVSAEPKTRDFVTGEDVDRAKTEGGREADVPALAQGQKKGSGGATYKLVESGAFDLSDHTTDRTKQKHSVPEKLIVTVTLPVGAEPTRNLDVVVAPRRLTIGVASDADDVPPRYLDLALPYDVEDDSKCLAVRDKAGLLKITMPIKRPPPPPPLPPPPPPAAMSAARETGAAPPGDAHAAEDGKETLCCEESKHPEVKAEEKSPTTTAATTSSRTDKGNQRKPDHSRWVNEAQPSVVFDKPWEAMVDGEHDETASAKESGDMDSLPPLPPAAADEEEAIEGKVEEDVDGFFKRKLAEDAPFIACAQFCRKIEGYEFKKDIMGCGYYRDDRNKKIPHIEWNETVKTMCGVVDVQNVIDSSVRYTFCGNKVALSFDAAAPAGEGGGRLSIESYRTDLLLSGGVAVEKCSHDTAEDNLAFKIVKEPCGEWESTPTPSRVTQTANMIDDVLESVGVSEEERVAAAAVGVGGKEGDAGGLAPGHGGIGSAGVGSDGAIPPMDFGSLAFELD